MQKLISVIILLALAVAGCKQSTEPTQPEQKPPGYQEDITWPSLANSPWPVWHHDMQATGRTNVAGPLNISNVNYLNVGIMYGDIVSDEFGTIYYQHDLPSKLAAMNLKGSFLWNINNGHEPSTAPTILSNKKIVVANDNDSTYCLNFDTSIKWTYVNNSTNYSKAISVDKNGNVYFVENNQSLVVLSPDGQLLWEINDANILTGSDQFVTFSPDGTTAYLMGKDITLIAVDISSHKILWKYGESTLRNTPLITNEGNIAIMENSGDSMISLTLLNMNGVILWKYIFTGHYLNDIEPTIDYFGNIYFGTDTLYSVNLKGKLNWKTQLGKGVSRYTAIICDGNNNIYFGAYSVNDTSKLLCYTYKGEKKWELTIENEGLIGNPIIPADGIIAIPTFNSNSLIIVR